MDNIQMCSKCIYDASISGIFFNEDSVCNYCIQVEELKQQYGTGEARGIKALNDLIVSIKKSGKGKKYDCIVGVSGGTDSSFLLAQAIEWGLRPLAVHYDNTWNSAIATENIRKVTSKLKVDLFTHVIDNKEADDIFRSFLFASVPEFDASTDLGFAQVIRQTAAKYGVKYILEGHSFVAEGITPMGKNYFDGKYIHDIHSRFGKVKMKTYPLMTFYQFMKWLLVYKQKFIRPLWYIDYSKEDAKKYLKDRFDWSDYNGHHLENRSSAFVHLVYHPQKFNMDNRNWTLSARVRSGALNKEDALKEYHSPIEESDELVLYVKKRLNLNDEEYNRCMNATNKNFTDYKTYKGRFEKLEPLFRILANQNLVPRSFYLKYCFPLPA
jgi:tRNA(Ile)-lysidine synthase TilS/MesJ